jgi:hypothetical protein
LLDILKESVSEIGEKGSKNAKAHNIRLVKSLLERTQACPNKIENFFLRDIYGHFSRQAITTFHTCGKDEKIFSRDNKAGQVIESAKGFSDPCFMRRAADGMWKGSLFFAESKTNQIMVSSFHVTPQMTSSTTKSRGLKQGTNAAVAQVSWSKPKVTDLAQQGHRGPEHPSVVEFKGYVYASGPSGGGSGADIGLSLYQCMHFPTKWQKIEDIEIVNGSMRATLLVHSGLLWYSDSRLISLSQVVESPTNPLLSNRLFNTRRRTKLGVHDLGLYSSGITEMDVYYTDDPHTGEWQTHDSRCEHCVPRLFWSALLLLIG